MRVLHVVHAFQTGGAERVVLNLARYASEDVANWICSLTQPHDLLSQLDTTRTGFCCLKKQEGNDFAVPRKLAELIDAQRIDVVHTQAWGTYIESLLAAKYLAKRKPPLIFAFHGKSLPEVERGVPLRQRLTQRVANFFTDACVAPARHMAEEYARTNWLAARGMQVIPNGVDTEALQRVAGVRGQLGLGLREDEVVVGFVGRLDPVKDLTGVIATFASLRQKLGGQRARLLLIGDGPERDTVRQAIAAQGLQECVIAAGLRSDITRCMSSMDIYFQPSRYEGHSITLLEAMSCSLPVVSTRVGGTPEIVLHGKTGFLHEPGQYAAMEESLLRLCSDPDLRASLGRAGRDFIVSRYSVQAMVRSYERLYRQLLGSENKSCAA
jgi:glycosyltransferase involved in cell wall biosynthesis